MALSDDQIRALFEQNDAITFYARNQNILKWRTVGIDGEGMPFLRLLRAIGITPEQIRPLLSHEEYDLPTRLNGYEDLAEYAGFGHSQTEFRQLAQLLGKKVDVRREYGDEPFAPLLFTVYPDGTIVREPQLHSGEYGCQS